MSEPIQITNHELGGLLVRQDEIKARFKELEEETTDWLRRVERLRSSRSPSSADKDALRNEHQNRTREITQLEEEARSNSARIKRLIASGALGESIKQAEAHKGGFRDSQHGWIGDKPVTFALGWGTKEGHTLIADGHLSQSDFRQSRNHDHFGPGNGPNNNGSLRGRYSGPGK